MVSLEGNPVHILQKTAQGGHNQSRGGYLSMVSGNSWDISLQKSLFYLDQNFLS